MSSVPIIRRHQWLWLLCLGLLGVRIAIAMHLPLLGDEAFYWQESRALAMSYSDVPPMTAWLIALGTAVAGNGLLGVRWPFLLIGALIPWLLRHWAMRRLGNRDDADRVAMLAMLLPLLGIAGVVAVPDVPLTFLMLLAFVLLDRAADRGRWRDWIVLGVCVAAALLTHWRAALLCSSGLIWLLLSMRGRRQRVRAGPWLAAAVAMLGLLPILAFNTANDWSALRFQLVERNPWHFQWSGVLIVPEQIMVISPLLALALFVVAVRSWRQRTQAPADLMCASALGIVAVYVGVGLFADNERTRIHWPLPGYLPLLLGVPALMRDWHQGGGWRSLVARLLLPVAALSTLAVLAALAWTASVRGLERAPTSMPFGTSFLGWPEVSAKTRDLLASRAPGTVLIADNFLLAAELDFATDGAHSVYSLDHARTIKHGRQAQLRIWARDEQALLAAPWQHGLLVFELGATAPVDRLAAWQALCDRFGQLRWIAEQTVVQGEVQFLFADVTPIGSGADGPCRAPLLARVDGPTPNQIIDRHAELHVFGWAIADDVGIAEVWVWLDGRRFARADLALPAPHVLQQWPHSKDPDHPRVGFALRIDADQLTSGKHRIEIEVLSRDRADLSRRFDARTIEVR